MAKTRKGSTRSPKRVLARPLARVGDPLVLPGGRVIQPTLAGGVEVEKVDAKPHSYKATKRRNLNEFAAAPGVLNGIACVIVYSLLGIGDREISDALKVKQSDVKEIRKHSVYPEIFDMIQEEFINVNSDRIQSRIAAYGIDAVEETARLMIKGKFETTRLKASQNIVDWGGHNKAAMAAKSSGMEPLRVTITHGDSTAEVSIGRDALRN